MAGDEILSVNDIEVTEVENAVEDLREALKGRLKRSFNLQSEPTFLVPMFTPV